MLWEGKLICSKCKRQADALYETERDLSLAKQGHGQSLCGTCLGENYLLYPEYDAVCTECREYTEGKGYIVDGKIVCKQCLTSLFWCMYEDGDNGFVYERKGECRSVVE